MYVNDQFVMHILKPKCLIFVGFVFFGCVNG